MTKENNYILIFSISVTMILLVANYVFAFKVEEQKQINNELNKEIYRINTELGTCKVKLEGGE